MPFSSSTGAANAQVMKNAMIPVDRLVKIKQKSQKVRMKIDQNLKGGVRWFHSMESIPKRSLPAGCVRITKRDTLECTWFVMCLKSEKDFLLLKKPSSLFV